MLVELVAAGTSFFKGAAERQVSVKVSALLAPWNDKEHARDAKLVEKINLAMELLELATLNVIIGPDNGQTIGR